MKARFLLFLLLFLAYVDCFSNEESSSKLPFPEGEQLDYTVGWNFIKVGRAVMLRNPNTTHEETPCLHFTFTVNTFGIADKIFRVRDRIDSYTDIALKNTLYYKQRQREGKTDRDIVVRFDRKNNLAHDTNHGKPNEKPHNIRPGLLDPLSMMYALRAEKPTVGKSVKLPATDGKKIIDVEVAVLKKESIKVPAGKFEALMLAPATKDLRGVFEKTKDSKIDIWVSADGRYVPLRLKSKVIVGSFIGELEKIGSSIIE